MPAKYSACISDMAGCSYTYTKPAGFQYPALPSSVLATCAPPIASPLPPAPIFKNSLEYFLNCASLRTTESNRDTITSSLPRLYIRVSECKREIHFGQIDIRYKSTIYYAVLPFVENITRKQVKKLLCNDLQFPVASPVVSLTASFGNLLDSSF